MTTTHRRPVAVCIVLGGIAALACACSSSSDPTPSLPVSSQPSAVPGTSGLTGPAAAGLTAYQAMWADVVAANQTSNYQAADLGDHLAGQALFTLTGNMEAEQKQGVVTLGQPVLHPVVVSTSPATVSIQDCVDDTHWLLYVAATHKLLNDIPGGDRATTATVADENGVWKVTEMNSGSDGSCHAP